jgi:hypothetical protein
MGLTRIKAQASDEEITEVFILSATSAYILRGTIYRSVT